MMGLVFDTHIISARGGREINEDYACFQKEPGRYAVWVLADGLGGHAAGEVASRLAADAVIQAFGLTPVLESSSLKRIFQSANQAILEAQAGHPAWAGMGTTLAAAFTDCQSLRLGYVGDSRLYLFRENRIILQTQDHSVSQLAVLSGEITPDQIRSHPERNRLIRSLGQSSATAKPSGLEFVHQLQAGDALLLCSDGFWEPVLEAEMEQDLAASADARDWCERMVARLKKVHDPYRDNYTAISIRVQSSPPADACPDEQTAQGVTI